MNKDDICVVLDTFHGGYWAYLKKDKKRTVWAITEKQAVDALISWLAQKSECAN